MIWPPQDTDLFAVAPCAFCPVEDLFSLREYDSVSGMEPMGRYYAGYGQTEAEGIALAEADGPAPWNVVATGFWRYGGSCGISYESLSNTIFKDIGYDYRYTDIWEAMSDDPSSCYAYRRLRFKREITGLTPSTEYNVAMNVERRVIDGTWSAYATITTAVMTDSTGRLTWEDDVPHARGYETWIAARTFIATPA